MFQNGPMSNSFEQGDDTFEAKLNGMSQEELKKNLLKLHAQNKDFEQKLRDCERKLTPWNAK